LTITLLYGCCQVETCTRNLDETRTFMIDVLGSGPIEQPLAKEISELIPGDDYDVDHIDCGEAVFQINRPFPSMTFNGQKSVHQAYLDRIGPCVTNLNFFIDDHAHARELLTSLGAEVHIEGPSSVARALADYGPDNTRPGGDTRPFLFLGTRHLIGLDLEIMEPNFLHFTRQSVQFPAFVQPRPRTGDGNLLLRRLMIATPDIEETYAKLVKIFAPASRSKSYHVQESESAKSFRVGLGGIEIEYCEPRSSAGELAQFLERFGPGVMAIAFGARHPEHIVEKCAARRVSVTEDSSPHRWVVASRAITGFDTVLERSYDTLSPVTAALREEAP
jgi:hypothetical protein